MPFLQPTIARVDDNPVTKEVQRIRIAFSKRKSLVTFGQIFISKWHENFVGIRFGPKERFGCAGNHRVRIAVDNFLKSLRIIVKAPDLGLWK